MKTGYIIENILPSTYNKIMLVYNYEVLNTIMNLPCILETFLLQYKSDIIGVWKIKTKK